MKYILVEILNEVNRIVQTYHGKRKRLQSGKYTLKGAIRYQSGAKDLKIFLVDV